jgi:hypothetical protein
VFSGESNGLHARVVAGGDRVGAEAGRAIDERRELQVAVAVRAGKGSAARGVLPDEVRHHLLVELALEIQDVVRDADRRRHFAGIVQIVERAAAAEGGLTLGLVVELHRQTNHVVTLLGEQGRGDRRVDAARHGDHNSHQQLVRGIRTKATTKTRRHEEEKLKMSFS